MKRLNFFLFGLAALGMTFFSSCTDDTTTPAPVISFTNNVSSASTANSSYTITGTITSEAGLEQVKYSKVTTSGSDQLKLVESFDDKNTFEFQFTVDGITEDITIEVEATDKENQTTSRNFAITYTGGASSINTYTAILVGAQTNTTYGSALDADAGQVYKLAAASSNQALIDVLYYYGSTNKATFAAPNDETVDGTGANSFNWTGSWTTKNATKFGVSTMTSTDFDAIDDADLAAITGLTATKVTDQNVDDVVEFITAGGKKGAIKVTALTATASGTITITVKVQQ